MSYKNTSSSKSTKPTKKNKKNVFSRKTPPSLSEQVRSHAEKIEKINILLVQKEHELADLMGQEKVNNKNTAEAQKQQMATASEQEQLIDELTSQLVEVDIKLTSAFLQNKHITAKNIVKRHMVAGMSLGLIPAPLFDLAALTGTQLNMLRTLSKHYGIDFDEYKSKALLTSLVSSSLPILTVLGLSSFAKLMPGIGTLGGGFSMAILSGAIVYATGQVFIRHLDMGGTLENFDSKYWKTYFKQEFEEGKLFVKSQLKRQKLEASESVEEYGSGEIVK